MDDDERVKGNKGKWLAEKDSGDEVACGDGRREQAWWILTKIRSELINVGQPNSNQSSSLPPPAFTFFVPVSPVIPFLTILLSTSNPTCAAANAVTSPVPS